MAETINIPAYSDALVVLGTAGVIVPLLRRWGVSPVFAYLGAGVVLGPLGLGLFIETVPLLYWFTVVDAKNVAGIADLGVVFLLFLIGLELSYQRLMSMRRLVFGLGGLQIAISTALIAGLVNAAGQPVSVAIVLGACLSLSSTAIVLELLSSQGRLTTGTGRASFAVLLAQDLWVAPLLLFISILGANTEGNVLVSIAAALAQAVVGVAVIVLVGRLLLRPLFRLVGGARSSDLFTAAILFVIVATGVVAALAGLSMALGAFVAGLLLAETEYRKAIQAIVEPFKGILLGIFFFTVGMNIDVRELAREPVWLMAGVGYLIALKAIVLVCLGRLFRLPWRTSIETGLLLAPGGEFAFVSVGLAAALGLMTPQIATFTLAVTSLTMLLIPLLSVVARKLRALIEKPTALDPALSVRPAAQRMHAIVVGYGRVGKVVSSLLKRHGVPYTAVDHNTRSVAEDRRLGHDVYFGDATSPEFLKASGLMEATGVIVTIGARKVVDEVVNQARAIRPDILIVSRARDEKHARHLYAIGVTDAVPETIEASLQLAEAALVGFGVPAGRVIASIHEQREEYRTMLQRAARGKAPPA